MKFSDISPEDWSQLQPYLDTCLLPVTGLDGSENPYQAAGMLEKLRDVLDLLELPYRGRTVTYPACHYWSDDSAMIDGLGKWAAQLKEIGFKYVIIVSAQPKLAELQIPSVDLVITSEETESIPVRITGLWRT